MTEYPHANMEEFVVDNDRTADWCIRKIAQLQKEADDWKKHYQLMCEKVQADTQYNVDILQAKLEDYFSSVPHKTTTTQQKYQLPSGTLILKKQQPRYTVDQDKTLNWLKDNFMHTMIRTKEEVNWGELKKQLTIAPDGSMLDENGEIVPGITAEILPDKFTIQMNGGTQ